MFETLKAFPADPILGISAAYAADASSEKVDVGVGVYRDDSGRTPVMTAIRLATARVAAAETTKSYLPTSGNAGFNRAISELVLGASHPAVADGRAAHGEPDTAWFGGRPLRATRSSEQARLVHPVAQGSAQHGIPRPLQPSQRASERHCLRRHRSNHVARGEEPSALAQRCRHALR